MKINKQLTTVTPFSKLLALLLFILLPIGAFYLGLGLKNRGVTLNSHDSSQKIGDAVNNLGLPSQANSTLVKEYGKIFFIDSRYGYRLDLSNLAQVEPSDTDDDQVYVFDMYSRVQSNNTSIARFGISELHENNEKFPLAKIAKNKYHYVEGKGISGNTTNSTLRETKINKKYDAIFWDSTSTGEGSSNQRDYLISVQEKYVHIQMYSWNEKNFNRALTDFSTVINTFQIQ